MTVADHFAELHVAGCLADAGWDIYFPHRDKGFDFVISRRNSPIVRPVQVKGKYPSEAKTDKEVYGYVGELTQRHSDMVLVIPFFSASSPNRPAHIAFMPNKCIKDHKRGARCEPAIYHDGEPKPRPGFQKFFDGPGIELLESPGWSNKTADCSL